MTATFNGHGHTEDLMAGLAEQIWAERAKAIDDLTRKTIKQLTALRKIDRSVAAVTEREEWGIRIWATHKVDGA